MHRYLPTFQQVSLCLIYVQVSNYINLFIYWYLPIYAHAFSCLCTGIFLFMYRYPPMYVPVYVLQRIVSEWSKLILWRLCEIWTHCARSRNILKIIFFISIVVIVYINKQYNEDDFQLQFSISTKLLNIMDAHITGKQKLAIH